MDRWRHVLVVGGTGMLAAATQDLARRCEVLTAVASTERSLHALGEATAGSGCEVHLLPLGWSEHAGFLEGVSEHVARVGAPSLVLAWLHEDDLGPALAEAVAGDREGCVFFQVRGSRAAAPSADPGALARDGRIPAHVRYHQVILGFKVEGDHARWLTHDEIARGTLEAVGDPRPLRVIGQVEPWELRP